MEKLHSSQAWNQIRDRFFETLDGCACMRAVSPLVEAEVLAAFHRALPQAPGPVALLAVGGFGRGELFPHSDIDLLFLHADEVAPPQMAMLVGPVCQTLWDLGLEPSHSVHSLRDITRFQADNAEFFLSLLDARPLAGQPALLGQFDAARTELLREKRPRLTERLFDLMDGRWRQFSFTIHHLEPDIKDGPGGLRDLHSLRWLAALKQETPFWDSPGQWETFQAEALQQLAGIRCFLHYQEGRNQNVLRFDAQEEWLDLLCRRGWDATQWSRQHYRRGRQLQRELQHWMERYSRPATALQRGIAEWRARLSNADFLVSRGMVLLKSPSQLDQDPTLALRLFAFLSRHGLPIAEDTIRRLRKALPAFVQSLATTPAAESNSQPTTEPTGLRDALLRICDGPHADVAVRAMESAGYLAAIFPEWLDIEALLVRDYYHRYTVDEHTLVCIDALCELLRGQKNLDPRMLDMAEQTDARALLVLALLFHDIGKKDGVDGHELRSREAARVALQRLQMEERDIDTVCLLVQQHLLLARMMRSRDLADPATGAELASVLGSLPNLRMLTLVTYADIRGVFPGALSPWRMDQLWSAFRIAQLAMEDRVAQERIRPAASYSSQELRYMEGFSTRYTRLFLPAQVHDHFLLYQEMLRGASGLRLRAVESSFELIAVCQDAPMRFAEVAGLLAALGHNILVADAFRNAHGVMLLRFRFEDPGRGLTLNPEDLDRLAHRLHSVLYHQATAAAIAPRRGQPRLSRGQRHLEPYVYSRNDVSPTLTMFEVGAADRPGLLYDIARTLAANGCTIDVLIVETRAHRAFDTLYVQKMGRELTADEQAEVTVALLQVLRSGR
ncbi:MAG: DUF294 nucleotidyltransferase-like domain-containing protein [Bryobacterales bacterium]|nr:DUF294 nucleotidyltransferase-like domain-containing protein [Bryobacterales bacterium]